MTMPDGFMCICLPAYTGALCETGKWSHISDETGDRQYPYNSKYLRKQKGGVKVTPTYNVISKQPMNSFNGHEWAIEMMICI